MAPSTSHAGEPDYELPPQLLLLARALAPITRTARQALERRVRPSGRDFVLLADISRHMAVIECALHRLTSRLDDLMSNVIRKNAVAPIEVGRSAGRLEQVFSEFVEGYLEAKASHPDHESTDARLLILGVYRHHILSMCSWLDELVFSINNPALAIQKRGIEPSSHVELTVAIDLTSPPEMAELGALIKRLQHLPAADAEPSFAPQRAGQRAPGVLATVGALAFGVGLSDALLGGTDGCATKKCT